MKIQAETHGSFLLSFSNRDLRNKLLSVFEFNWHGKLK